jgi:hypothetical protein
MLEEDVACSLRGVDAYPVISDDCTSGSWDLRSLIRGKCQGGRGIRSSSDHLELLGSKLEHSREWGLLWHIESAHVWTSSDQSLNLAMAVRALDDFRLTLGTAALDHSSM